MKKTITNKNDIEQDIQAYAFYSKELKQVFDSVDELKAAEASHRAELKAKEDQITQKKADAQKVEEAFKALNLARKAYKDDTTALTKEYAESLDNLKKAYDLGIKDIKGKLATAEESYKAALKEFTDKYDTYHLSLKDGDFETTISSQTNGVAKAKVPADISKIADLFDLMFRF
jgi:chromosome segregation ATPase